MAVVEPHSVVERQHSARGDVARREESLSASGHRRLPDPDQVHLRTKGKQDVSGGRELANKNPTAMEHTAPVVTRTIVKKFFVIRDQPANWLTKKSTDSFSIPGKERHTSYGSGSWGVQEMTEKPEMSAWYVVISLLLEGAVMG